MSKTVRKFKGKKSNYPETMANKGKFKMHDTSLYDDYSDYERDDSFMYQGKFRHIYLFALLISLTGSSCVSKKILTGEQELSSGYYEQLTLCQE